MYRSFSKGSWIRFGNSRIAYCVKSVRIRSYSGPHFPTFGLNTKKNTSSLRIQSEYGKKWTRITPNTKAFYAVSFVQFQWCTFNSNAGETKKVTDSTFISVIFVFVLFIFKRISLTFPTLVLNLNLSNPANSWIDKVFIISDNSVKLNLPLLPLLQ